MLGDFKLKIVHKLTDGRPKIKERIEKMFAAHLGIGVNQSIVNNICYNNDGYKLDHCCNKYIVTHRGEGKHHGDQRERGVEKLRTPRELSLFFRHSFFFMKVCTIHELENFLNDKVFREYINFH